MALGLLEIAKIQKRGFFVIHFDSSHKSKLYTNRFPKNEPYDVSSVISMSEFFACGGTDFEQPLELSRDLIEEDIEYNKADIILITDGEAAVGKDWLKDFLKWKKLKNVSIYTVLIDVDVNSATCVKSFSDRIEKLSMLRHGVADDLAMDIFSNM